MLTKEALKKIVIEIVRDAQGIKATELAVKMVMKLKERAMDKVEGLDIPALIESLVKEGRIDEVEYELPSMKWRTKSILFPAGTVIRIIEPEDKL